MRARVSTGAIVAREVVAVQMHSDGEWLNCSAISEGICDLNRTRRVHACLAATLCDAVEVARRRLYY